MPSDDRCPKCHGPVRIPGLDQLLCSSCGWVTTEWGHRQEQLRVQRQQESRRQAAAKRAAARTSKSGR